MASNLPPRTSPDWGIAPALAGSVILTTGTDVIGFFAFLGFATVLPLPLCLC